MANVGSVPVIPGFLGHPELHPLIHIERGVVTDSSAPVPGGCRVPCICLLLDT